MKINVDAVRGLAAQDMTTAQIAKKLGTTTQAIYKIASRHGIDVPKLNTADDYSALAAQGLTVDQIAERLGVTPSAVRKFVAKHGITVAGGRHKNNAPAWRDLYNRHPRPTAKEAAEARGVRPQAAYEWAEKNGLEWTVSNKKARAAAEQAPVHQPTTRRFGFSADAIARFEARRVSE